MGWGIAMIESTHVVLNFDTGVLLCKHCLEEYKPNLPVAVKIFTAIADAFVEIHSQCKAASDRHD